MKLMDAWLDRRIAAYQEELMTRHMDEVENIYRTMRGWRHDYHNHIQALRALTDQLRDASEEERAEKLAAIDSYLNDLNHDLTTVDTVLKTGNVMVDAILNSKLSLIRSRGIALEAKAAVPKELTVSQVDLCAMLGNLLDNALEACMACGQAGEAPWIRVYLGVFKGQLYISVANSAGEIRREGKRYISTKRQPGHGLGLMRVDRLAAKYGGYVNRQSEPGVFATELLLPL